MAVFPNARGFAYVTFESPLSPVDWGMTDLSGKRKNQKRLRRLTAILDRCGPDVLVLRDVSYEPRARYLPQLVRQIEQMAARRGIVTVRVSREQIQEAFAHLEAPTRYAVVCAIAKNIPMFEPFVPPARKIWKGEDRRMGLFDAAALALTFYRLANGHAAG